ncbi:MAG: hypothetical protein AB2598_10475 [Candidatus Thiodiazotropha sp.]
MNIIKSLIVLLFIVPMTACAAQTMPEKSDNFFYSIDKEGNIVAVDSAGKEVTLKRIDIPFKHNITEIKSIQTLTIIEFEGSHFKVVCTSSRSCRLQPLPH